MKRYEVHEFNLCGGFANNWSDESGPSYFETYEAAEAELNEFLADCECEVIAGNMPDSPSRDDFLIVEVLK
jgi:hypothetical protein